jgi:hypothetical protein
LYYELGISYNVNIMDIHDRKALQSKRLPSNPIAYADMEERYNKTHSPASNPGIDSTPLSKSQLGHKVWSKASRSKALRSKKSKPDPFKGGGQ